MVIHVFVIFIGLVFGSFVYNFSFRLLFNQSQWKRSHCDHCKKTISILGLVPVLGYLIQGGRCSYCKNHISFEYPLFEICNAFFSWVIYQKTGFLLQWGYHFLIWEAFLVLALLDFKTQLIYPQPVLFIIFIHTCWLVWTQDTTWYLDIIAMFLGAGIFHFMDYFFQVFRGKRGIGEGDFTLLGIIGFYGGWHFLLPVIFYSAILGIVLGSFLLIQKKESFSKPIAFGPYLILGTWIHWYFPKLGYQISISF